MSPFAAAGSLDESALGTNATIQINGATKENGRKTKHVHSQSFVRKQAFAETVQISGFRKFT